MLFGGGSISLAFIILGLFLFHEALAWRAKQFKLAWLDRIVSAMDIGVTILGIILLGYSLWRTLG